MYLTAASGLCFIVSRNIEGRNLVTQIRTLGPTSLSVTILLRTSALFSLLTGTSELHYSKEEYLVERFFDNLGVAEDRIKDVQDDWS